jgi:GR25 family glycosyltransferase involved in LPS biosynthesis
LDLPCEFVDAVDGQSMDIQQLHDSGMIADEAVSSIAHVSAGNRRPTLEEVGTTGAVGCYLSHVKLWERMLHDLSLENMLVFEDDAIVTGLTSDMLTQRLSDLPNDWHMYLVGQPHTRMEAHPIGKVSVSKVTKFCGTHGYIISRAGVSWLLQHGDLLPVTYQIDSKLSKLTQKGLHIYMHKDSPMVSFTQGHSDVQS